MNIGWLAGFCLIEGEKKKKSEKFEIVVGEIVGLWRDE